MSELIEARYRRGGVYLPETDLWLDPHGARDTAFVSHAHADHFARHQTILCSERTHALIKARYSLKKQTQVIALAYREVYTLDDGHEICLFPAGHILGSAQIHLTRKSDGATLMYTGDFKLRESYSSETIESRSADTLIMETTFGLPHFRFPTTDEVVADIIKFCIESIEDGAVPIILGYSLGKAQEILAALSEAELPVMLHRTVYGMTAVYEQFLTKFPKYSALDVAQADGHVLIMPPAILRSKPLQALKNRRTAMLSGWAMQSSAKYRYGVDRVFALSDHADYADLKAYVAQVQPKRVLTLHGYAAEFARDLRDDGIDAWSILADNQMDLKLSLGKAMADLTPNPREKVRPMGGLARLTDVCAALRNSTGREKKITLLAGYFANLRTKDLPCAARILVGSQFKGMKRTFSLAMIGEVLRQVSGMGLSKYRELAVMNQDVGRTASLVLQGVTEPEVMELVGLEQFCEELDQAKGPLAKQSLVAGRLQRMHPTDAGLLVRMLTNGMKLGLQEGVVEEAIAHTFDREIQAVLQAQRNIGDIGDTAVAAKEDRLKALSLQPFVPVACGTGFNQAVWVQLHCVQDRAALFSADLSSWDTMFPELLNTARESLSDSLILNGELIVCAEGRKLTLRELRQRRVHKKRLQGDLFLGEAVPVRLMVHDVLWLNGVSLLDQPLPKRQRRLQSIAWPETFEYVGPICD